MTSHLFYLTSLVDIKSAEAGQVLAGGQRGLAPPLGSIVEAGGAEDEGVALPRLLVLRLEPDLALHLGGGDAGAGEEFLHKLLATVLLHALHRKVEG